MQVPMEVLIQIASYLDAKSLRSNPPEILPGKHPSTTLTRDINRSPIVALSVLER
jgi:hypothetical protein